MPMLVETKANPYASSSSFRDSGFEGAPKERTGRTFRFNPKGKYVQLAKQIEQDRKLEELKQRIVEGAKKAGLDSEFETLEKNIRVSVCFLLGIGGSDGFD
jgi:U4/U6 small nuclear ribonucleoprotein PRP3